MFVLVHSPSVGPRTWQPVADRLTGLGWDVVVPSLLHVAEGGPPFWPRVVDPVCEACQSPEASKALPGLEQDPDVILVVHSNAGLFVPVIAAGLRYPVLGCVFVDAGLPPRSGETPVAPPELLPFLRDKAPAGMLPRWTEWWDEHDVAALFPDEQPRRAVTEEQPRLPLAYYEASVPVPAGWDDRPCAYLLFGPAYEDAAAEAGRRGWVVQRLPGEHLHQLVDPDGVAQVLAALAGRMGAEPARPPRAGTVTSSATPRPAPGEGGP